VSISPTDMFHFLQSPRSYVIDMVEVISPTFSLLRRHVLSIVASFAETDESSVEDISQCLRATMSQLLTVPLPFGDTIIEALQLLGDPNSVAGRWGRDVNADLVSALGYARALRDAVNPLRDWLRTELEQLIHSGISFRILCHSRDEGSFRTILSDADSSHLLGDIFIHTVAEYRQCVPFEVLVKVGPLRSRGWAKAPDAILTAPRFSRLIEGVWSGCGNEEGFGYDPIAPARIIPFASDKPAPESETFSMSGTTWEVRRTRLFRDDLGSISDTDVDDLQVFTELGKSKDLNSAILVRIDREHCILYPPHSRVLSFDPASDDAVAYRMAADGLIEGMWLVLAQVDEPVSDDLRAGEGQYSHVWKQKLEQKYRQDPTGLCERLHFAGLNLLHLSSRIEHWCKPATTVIPAPQRMTHFEMLIDELGIESASENNPVRVAHWWKRAWNEIRRSRGEAIQFGFQEQHAEDQELLIALTSIEPQIRDQTSLLSAFQLAVPSQLTRGPHFRLFRIELIEDGYQVPQHYMRMILELEVAEQWRE